MATERIESFWGDHRFLSNFHPCEVELEGKRFASVEHAYQAAKVLDPQLRREIAAQPTPGLAKRFMAKRPVRDNWDEMRIHVMRALLRQKFEHEPLRAMLIDTVPAELVEANTWGDTYWGVCDGVGDNHLGRLLMEIRTLIAIVDGRDPNRRQPTEAEIAEANEQADRSRDELGLRLMRAMSHTDQLLGPFFGYERVYITEAGVMNLKELEEHVADRGEVAADEIPEENRRRRAQPLPDEDDR